LAFVLLLLFFFWQPDISSRKCVYHFSFIREMNRRCVTNQIHWQYFSRVAGSSISMSW